MQLIALVVTFCVFFAEALFHFNLGKTGTISLKSLSIPQGPELFNIVKVLAFFSVLNAFLIPMVTDWFYGPPELIQKQTK